KGVMPAGKGHKGTWGGRASAWYCSGVGACTGEGVGEGVRFGGKTSWGVLFGSLGFGVMASLVLGFY
nr:hypothetical protein [Tanacetum cinerariifolium]